jgi:hypothetical protein
MKNTKAFLILVLSFFLVSCGQGGKTSATLEVSSSFALSNATYDGGLILYGKSGANSFTRALSQNGAASSNIIDIVLPNGNWTFYATGWKNSSGEPMSGDIFCGEASADLKGSDTRINLNINQESCATPSFTNTIMRDLAGPNRVKRLSLVSCNAFYDNAGAPITASTNKNFCGDNNIPLDMRNQARSFKIIAESKAIAGEALPPGFTSSCRDFNGAAANGVSSFRDSVYRIPSSNTPIKFELYENSNCTKLISSQPMLEGISFNYGDDKVFLNGDAVYGGLVLASNQTRKGLSNFYALLPNFKCGGNLCVAGNINTSFQFYAARRSDGKIRLTLDRDPNSVAGDYAITSLNNFSSQSCAKSDDEYYCEFQLSVDGGVCFDGANNYCWSDAPKSFSFDYSKNGSGPVAKTVYVFKEEKDYRAVDLSLKFTGRLPNTPVFDSKDFDDDKTITGDYGLIDQPRFLFSPMIAGLVSVPGQTCATASAIKQIELKDDEDDKNYLYEIKVQDAPVLSPISLNTYQSPLFCDETDLSGAGCGGSSDNIYQKRFTVKRLVSPGNWQLFIVMDFSCDASKKSGRFQQFQNEYTATYQLERTEKSILAWFTPPVGSNERLEFYHLNKEFDPGTNQIKRYEAGFTRLYRILSSDFAMNGMHYRREFTTYGSIYDESAARYFHQSSSGATLLYYNHDAIMRGSSDLSGNANTSMVTDVSPIPYTIGGNDIRTLNSPPSNVDTKFMMTSPAVSSNSQSFINQGNPQTNVRNINIEVSQLTPAIFEPLFNDGFFYQP